MNKIREPAVVMIGSTGAVGSICAAALAGDSRVTQLSLLGRRPNAEILGKKVAQHTVDIFSLESYRAWLPEHDSAICTLGVGEPSKVSRDDFVRIDRDAVLDFAMACKASGVKHFQLLSSVGVSSQSRSFFLRTKGELEDGLAALAFDRLSLFHPSMILTPKNRYGFSQAVTLAVWPKLTALLQGPLRKFRGIPVDMLGTAMARNLHTQSSGIETLEWDEIVELAGPD